MATGSASVGLLVPADIIGRVIGKQGSGLRQLREGSGCKVDCVQAGPDRSEPRRVNLSGPPTGLSSALSAVLHILAQGQATTEASLLVPQSLTGSLIGKQGQNLKRLREGYGVKLHIERDPMSNPSTGEQERMVNVNGDPGSIGQALGMSFSAAGGGGGGGGCGGLGGGNAGGAFAGGPGGPFAGGAYVSGGGGPGGPGGPFAGGGGGGGGGGKNVTPPGLSQEVQPMTDDPDVIQVHHAIPSQVVGTIAGEEGSTMGQLSAESGCRMSASNLPDCPQQYIVIVGGLHAVSTAQQLLDRLVQQAESEIGHEHDPNVSAIFWVPREASGAIIGKGGAGLGQIREQTGVQVNFGREEVRGLRPCAISGLLDNVLQAETLVVNLLEERELSKPAKRAGGMEDGMGADPKRSRIGGVMLGPESFQDHPQAWQDPMQPTFNGNWHDGAIMPSTWSEQPQSQQQLHHQPNYQTIGSFAATGVGHGVAPPGPPGQAGQTKFLVPARSAGLVVGKQGSGLAKIRQESGVKLEMLQAAKAPHFPEDRVVIIQGPRENRVRAIHAVLQAAFGGSDTHASLKILVEPRGAGLIIGKQGATLKQLRQTAGVGCQIEKNEIFGERLVTASGALPGVLSLADSIINLLN